jgi:hypothetical protein
MNNELIPEPVWKEKCVMLVDGRPAVELERAVAWSGERRFVAALVAGMWREDFQWLWDACEFTGLSVAQDFFRAHGSGIGRSSS